jgi:2-desacetyl-2-hydroxyethyl bacteriochlorophyllide A dehydrogenase
MKAAVFKEKGVFAVEEVPDPEVGPRDILIEISHCAICGSDLHRYAYGMLRQGAVIGHEYAGTVVGRGAEVSEFDIGDRVTRSGGKPNPPKEVFGYSPRYSARERGFFPAARDGGYAQYIALDADMAIKIPGGLSNLHAALAEPLAVAVHGTRVSPTRLGDTVLVLGAGPIGLLTLQCLRLAGAMRIFVSEPNESRRNLAGEFGADEVFDPRQTDIVEEVVDRTGIGVDVVFECAGAEKTYHDSLQAVRFGGTVVLVAMAWEPVYCLPVDWIGREVQMKAAYGYLPSEWLPVMWLLETGQVTVSPMISSVVPLSDIQSTFQELMNPDTELVQAVVAPG